MNFARFSGIRRWAAAIAASALIAALVPAAALAQDVPSYAVSPTISTDETIHGRIRSVDGAFDLTVDDDRGFVDSIQLHPGTIINPTGLTLSAGMSVTILGVNAGSTFAANEIDTPYSYDGPLPTPVYYGDGYWYPGFAYGYGPSFSLAIVFGGGQPWCYANRPFHARPWNGHAYFGGYVRSGAGGHVAYAHPLNDAHAPAAFAGRSFAGDRGEPAAAPRSEFSEPNESREFSSTQTRASAAPSYGRPGGAPSYGASGPAGGYSGAAHGESGHGGEAHGGSVRAGRGHGGGHGH